MNGGPRRRTVNGAQQTANSEQRTANSERRTANVKTIDEFIAQLIVAMPFAPEAHALDEKGAYYGNHRPGRLVPGGFAIGQGL